VTTTRTRASHDALTSGLVGLTHQHTNREVLVEGPEITIRRVGTRRLVSGGAQ
jgi:hypothetical protein